ncbi:MAG: sulfurtransferase [Rickettsiales bacterium]|nr:sulfurtransferase [Rickettsiales bacterium]
MGQSLANPLSGISPTYAGDLSPNEAWQFLSDHPHAQLIDVRTQPEWLFTGTANLSALGRATHTICWKTYPAFEVDPHFVEKVKAAVPDTNVPLLFLCKTGGRSLDAACAMTQAGYSECYNIAEGYEGAQDANGQRGTTSGWKAAGLPWEQA